MTATLSIFTLEAIGFREVISKGSITASFISVTVYEARGIALPDGFAEARQAEVAGVNYRVALSKYVNAGCQCLIGDDFTESESDWLKEFKTSGPFVLIAVGPTEFIECETGRIKMMPDGSITTYDSFPSMRMLLKSLEDRVLPPIVSTLTLALNEPERYVALRRLDRKSAGRTPDGVTVRDFRINMSAELTLARTLSGERASEILEALTERAPKLTKVAAKYFALGIAEEDQLKKFLFFFLSLEVETHAVFKSIDHAQKLRTQLLRDGKSEDSPSVTELLKRDISKWGSLFDRFVWCVTCSWLNLTDEDIKEFKKLKVARDDIAHGKCAEPPAGFARKAELLAHKVFWA